ncbi:hypothetical protein L6452_38842 [Arctium lappa]|uniref:Uncharacterized protein n=1 Tax=Arctium lappa TaxID=4217 RepID=A0ACB8XR79_ARCLA|nr:hypothetical protein L6452_38842 [Arctium lappa]
MKCFLLYITGILSRAKTTGLMIAANMSTTILLVDPRHEDDALAFLFLAIYILLFCQGDSILADSGTEQLEFIALSQRTGDPKYQQKKQINKRKRVKVPFQKKGMEEDVLGEKVRKHGWRWVV